MKTLYLDCFCGISGDMTVGALVDVGAPMSAIAEAVRSMSLAGVSVAANTVMKKGIQATSFQVSVDKDVQQPHRHLPDILRLIEQAALPAAVKTAATATFQTLGAAEAEVHGLPIEKVHFHEVGAADSIVDIVAANLALHDLGIEHVIASPLVVGSGTVQCDHGIMPVPAPATALLLCGLPWKSGDAQKELATPTGVALVKQWAAAFGTVPIMNTTAVGYGAGTRDLSDRANVLRVFLGQMETVAAETTPIFVLETNIDDMNPELTALLIPATLEAGARDAFITPVMAKKGRAAHCLTVLCDSERIEAVMEAVFRNSGTLGIRIREERRRTLEREIRTVTTQWGAIPVKVGLQRNAIHCVAPEFDVCCRLAKEHGVAPRRVYESALTAALRGEFTNE